MGRIRYTTPDGIEQVVDLNEFNGHVTIGRTPDCDVYANSLSVSRSHAQVWFEDGQYHVLDLNSSNGTFLNGRKIEKAILTPGDLLKCGEFTMVFEDDDMPAAPYRGSQPVEEINVDADAIEEAGPSWEELQQKDEEINRLRGTVADLEDKLAQVQNQNAALEEDLNNVRAQGAEEANIARASLEQELEAAQQDISALTAQNNQLTSQTQTLSSQNNQLANQSKDLAAQNSQLNSQIKEINARLAEITAEQRETMSQLKNTEKELADLRRAPPVADGLLPAEELQLRQEMLSLKEEIYRLRKTSTRAVS
jgi:pSer/pThr/pTyr-binding forkhead associated (FHA) protein